MFTLLLLALLVLTLTFTVRLLHSTLARINADAQQVVVEANAVEAIGHWARMATPDAWDSALWVRMATLRNNHAEEGHAAYCNLHPSHFGICASHEALLSTSPFN